MIQVWKIRKYINWGLALVKWPVAIASMLVVPAAVQALYRYYVIRAQLNWDHLWYFIAGLVFFTLVRVFVIMRRGAAETLEHEITHTLFAMLTLHPVHDMKINDEGGGSMRFSGGGNWLIAIAPYFFPLSAFLMLFLSIAVGRIVGYMPDWVYIGLGCAVAYNLSSFAQQLHPYQTDFKVAGYLFTLCFLPGANILAFGTVFAFVERGWPGIVFFYRLIGYFVRHDFVVIWRLLRGQ